MHAAVLAMLFPCAAAHASCGHDKMVRRSPVFAAPRGESGRRAANFESLRVFFDFDGIDTSLPAAQQAYIRKLLEDAGTWLQTALMVRRKTTPLKAKEATICGDVLTVPDKYITTGVTTDVLIFVLASQASSGCSGGGTLAYASHCEQDPDTDRPIIGYIMMCPQHHEVKTVRGRRDEDLHTAIHEVLHILGWSDGLFPWFRDESNNPRTARCPNLQGPLPVGVQWLQDKTYTDEAALCCASNTIGHPPFFCKSQRYSTSTGTVLVETGAKPVLNTVTDTHKLIRTPKVLELAREHFACSSLAGVELEDDGGAGSAGSHWEKRQMFTEFMCADPSGFQNTKSVLTLALMEDSGWYKANYTAADTLRWGRNKGCDFTQTCGPVSSSGWCSLGARLSCTFDRSAFGNCSIRGFPSLEGCAVVPASYHCNLFMGESATGIGGSCGGRDCYGSATTQASACFESTLQNAEYVITNHRGVGCYEYECGGASSSPTLRIRDPAGTWRTCSQANEAFGDIQGYQGSLQVKGEGEGG